MRKEIEIVKKSLEEMKEKAVTPPPTTTAAEVDLSKNLTSASDLLALVQASIQSKAPMSAPSAISTLTSNTLVNNTQPRSFGDMQSSIESLAKPENTQFSHQVPDAAPLRTAPAASVQDEHMHQSSISNFDEPLYQQNKPMQTYNDNFSIEPYNQNDEYNQIQSYNRNNDYNQVNSYNDGGVTYNHPPVDTYNEHQSYNQGDSYKQNEPYNANDNTYNQNNSFAQNKPYNQNQNQSYIQPWANTRQNLPDNRGAINQGFNQGGLMPTPAQNQFQPRGNFNGRQDSVNMNQFNNFNNGNNFRGRGNFSGGPRSYGRGRF